MFHREGRTYFHDTKPFSLTLSLFFQMLYLLSVSWNRFSVMCICSVIDHKWLKNVVKTKKKWHLGRSRLCRWCPYDIPTSSVFYYRLYRSMVKWNLFVYIEISIMLLMVTWPLCLLSNRWWARTNWMCMQFSWSNSTLFFMRVMQVSS